MSRGSPLRRKVAGLTLQKTIGRRYVSLISGQHVIFRAILHPCGRVRSWESVYSDWAHGPRNAGCMTFGLRNCVIATQHLIIKGIRDGEIEPEVLPHFEAKLVDLSN